MKIKFFGSNITTGSKQDSKNPSLVREFHVLEKKFTKQYSQTYIKKPALGRRKSDLIKPLKRCSIGMRFSRTGQEKGDLLIQVTA